MLVRAQLFSRRVFSCFSPFMKKFLLKVNFFWFLVGKINWSLVYYFNKHNRLRIFISKFLLILVDFNSYTIQIVNLKLLSIGYSPKSVIKLKTSLTIVDIN